MDLTGQSFPFGRNSAYRRRELISKFSQFVDLLEREVHNFNPIQAESEIVHYLLNTISEILEDGFSAPGLGENEEEELPHYWSKITDTFDFETVRFVNSLEQFATDSEKAYVWILIELFNKNIYNIFTQFAASESYMNYYYPRSLIKKHGANVLEILKKLCGLDYIIDSKFLRAYQEHVSAAYYIEPEAESHENILSRSPSRRRSSDFTPHKSEHSEIAHHKHHKSSVDSPFNIPGASSASYENTRTSSLFKSGSSLKGKFENAAEKKKENNGEIQEFEEMDESSSLKINTVGHLNRPGKSVDYDADKISTPEWKHKSRNSKMRRTSSYQNMNGNNEDSILQVERFISSPLHCSVHSQDASPKSLSISKLKKKSGYGTPDEEASTAPEGKKKLVIAGFSGIKNDLQNTYDTPIFKTTLDRHGDPIGFSMTQTERTPKNSESLYAEIFHRIQYQSEYKKPPSKKTKAEDQQNKCFSCGAVPNKKFLIFWSKLSYCSYTGYWYCGNCMASEKAIIPWNVSESWDFTALPVCKKAYEELMQLFGKPNMMVDYNSLIVKRNSLLYETLVTRRQLHLIFDMICDPLCIVNIMGGENINLLLKQNLFSLENLIEINKGNMLLYLEKCYEIANKHVVNCEICSTRGKRCEICQIESKIFHYDIKNTAICNSCKRLYHSKCFIQKRCPDCK